MGITDWTAAVQKVLSEEEQREYEKLARECQERATGQCLCGGPRGHVPNGIHCRKPLNVPEE